MKPPLAKDEIEFEAWIDQLSRYATVRRRGRHFIVAGRDVALFSVSVMAEALGRDVRTLRRWEKLGYWPTKCMWKVPDDKRTKRWYSRDQILGVQKKHQEMAKGSHGFAHSPHFPMREFLTWVLNNLNKQDAWAYQQKEQGK